MTDVSKIDDDIFDLYEQLEQIVKTKQINAINLIEITIDLMKIVEDVKDISGKQKKDLIIETLEKFINEKVSDEKEREELLFIVKNVVPSVIDTVVSIDLGELSVKFNKLWKRIRANIKKLFC